MDLNDLAESDNHHSVTEIKVEVAGEGNSQSEHSDEEEESF